MCRWINKFFVLVFALGFVLSQNAVAFDVDNHFINPQYSKRISLDFKAVALTEALKVFSKQSGMNFITSSEVADRKVTLFLENIPVEEALQKMLDANNLEYSQEAGSNIFVVKNKKSSSEKIITRVYVLKHASVNPTKFSDTFKDEDSESSSSSDSSDSSSSKPSGSDSSSSKKEVDIIEAVKMVLAPNKGGVVIGDYRTNSLIVTDIESRFPIIEQTIAMLDVEVDQILIEVEMLDISKNTSDLMGVRFGDEIFNFRGANKVTMLPFNQSEFLKKNETDMANYLAEDVKQYTLGTMGFNQLTAVINFLKTKTDTKSLAKPRIITLNNQMAQINITTDQAVSVTQTVTSGTTTTAADEVTRFKTGVFLAVTPQINSETREILMAIYPKVVDVRIANVTTSSNQAIFDPEERTTQSLVRVKDGETILIGGLLRTESNNVVTKVPLLGDIPFVGGAFRHKNKRENVRELIIFMTPHILDGKNASLVNKSNNPSKLDVEAEQKK